MFNLFCSPVTIVPLRYRVLTSAVLATLLTISLDVSAADTAKYEISRQSVPEITLFNPEATTAITFIRTHDFEPINGSGNFFSICQGGTEWVKGFTVDGKANNQQLLASFIAPKFQGNINPDENNVVLGITNDTPYTLYLPLSARLKSGEADFKTHEGTVTFGVRGAYPFGGDCAPTAGVQQLLENVTIPVRSIADATPLIQQLVPGQQQLAPDGKTFTAKVKILGVTTDNSVVWVDDNNPNGLPMTQAEEITTQKDDEHGFTGKEHIGGWYTVSLPVATKLSYTAKVQVTKTIQGESSTFEEPMVNSFGSQPYLKASNCSDSQCQITVRSVIPYRDVDGSLGLRLKGDLALLGKTKLPAGIFTMQSNSGWRQIRLFSGQTETNLAQSNWKLYSNSDSPFLTSSPLPQEGVFLLNFEPDATQ